VKLKEHVINAFQNVKHVLELKAILV